MTDAKNCDEEIMERLNATLEEMVDDGLPMDRVATVFVAMAGNLVCLAPTEDVGKMLKEQFAIAASLDLQEYEAAN